MRKSGIVLLAASAGLAAPANATYVLVDLSVTDTDPERAVAKDISFRTKAIYNTDDIRRSQFFADGGLVSTTSYVPVAFFDSFVFVPESDGVSLNIPGATLVLKTTSQFNELTFQFGDSSRKSYIKVAAPGIALSSTPFAFKLRNATVNKLLSYVYTYCDCADAVKYTPLYFRNDFVSLVSREAPVPPADAIVPVAPPGAVPEPAAWATMIAGFGAIGAAQRRRQARPA